MTEYLRLAIALVIAVTACTSTESVFNAVRAKDTIAAYESFVRMYPDSLEAPAARKRLDELRQRDRAEAELRANQDSERVKTANADKIAKLQKYVPGVTTEASFREDGWNPYDPSFLILGVVGFLRSESETVYILGVDGTARRVAEKMEGFDKKETLETVARWKADEISFLMNERGNARTDLADLSIPLYRLTFKNGRLASVVPLRKK